MTATSAQSPPNANPFPDLATSGAEPRTVLLPGSPSTYANRTLLREMGLRWDPAGHRWHGTTTTDRVRELREWLGLEVRCFGMLEFALGSSPPKPPARRAAPMSASVTGRNPSNPPRDGARTCLESRIAFPTIDDEREVSNAVGRNFSVLEITSGLPDDSCEEERRLRDLRKRVKVAWAVVATTPGLTETLARDWKNAALFYSRYGITEGMFRNGVKVGNVTGKALANESCHPMNTLAEGGEHPRGVLPSAA